MTQKLPFNNTGTPVFAVGDQEAVLFHKFTLPDGEAPLWGLSLWAAVNGTVAEGTGPSYLTLVATPPGEGVGSPNAVVIVARTFEYEAALPADPEVGDQGKIYQIAFDYPVRGPLDLYAVGVVPNADQFFTCWGYVLRGDESSKAEGRFLNASAIGDQVSSFTGGQGIDLAPGDGEIIHETGDDYIDEMVLDVVATTNADTDPEVSAALGWSNAPGALIAVRMGKYPIHIFEGIPFRSAGQLAVTYPDVGDVTPIVLNGSYARG